MAYEDLGSVVVVPVNSGYSALFGSATGRNGDRINVWVEYKADQNIEANTSHVQVHFYAALKDGSESNTHGEDGLNSSILIDGVLLGGQSDDKYDFQSSSTLNYFGSASLEVAHNESGEKSISISCTFKTKSSYITGGSVSATIKLPTIPQATKPVLSVESIEMGKQLAISLPRTSVDFTHTVSYAFMGAAGVIAEGVGTSATWDVPLSLAGQIPNAANGVCTITCETFQGGSSKGKKTAQVTLVVPNDETTRPTVQMMLSGDTGGAWVQGKSRVTASITAVPKEGAQIAEYSLVVGSSVTNGASSTLQSALIPTSGSVMVIARATDTRGYTGEATQTIDVFSYSVPRVVPYTGEEAVICERCDSSGIPSKSGTYLLIKAGRQYSPLIVNGEKTNTCSLIYRYKFSDDDQFESGWVTFLDAGAVANEVQAVVGGSFESSSSYTVEISAVDSFEESGNVVVFDIPTDLATFHLGEGGHKAAFFKYAERDNALEIAEGHDLYLHGMTIKEYINAVINGTI